MKVSLGEIFFFVLAVLRLHFWFAMWFTKVLFPDPTAPSSTTVRVFTFGFRSVGIAPSVPSRHGPWGVDGILPNSISSWRCNEAWHCSEEASWEIDWGSSRREDVKGCLLNLGFGGDRRLCPVRVL